MNSHSGPFKDDLGGMIILEADDLTTAAEIVLEDPAVKSHVMTFELHAWHPAAPGQVESRPWSCGA